MAEPLFELGGVVGTPGVVQALEEAGQDPHALLARHVTGDWGDVPEDVGQENELGVAQGKRIFSAYVLSTDVRVWVFTEDDRSVTTLLLPEEYHAPDTHTFGPLVRLDRLSGKD